VQTCPTATCVGIGRIWTIFKELSSDTDMASECSRNEKWFPICGEPVP